METVSVECFENGEVVLFTFWGLIWKSSLAHNHFWNWKNEVRHTRQMSELCTMQEPSQTQALLDRIRICTWNKIGMPRTCKEQ